MKAINDQDYAFLRSVLSKEAGIALEEGKEYLVAARLTPVALQHGLGDITNLITKLRGWSPDLRADVIDAMTVNETSFYRDRHVWTALATEVLPAIIKARSTIRRLDFWCAASSSGQEPYTLAMILYDLLGDSLGSWRIRIMATDLSRHMVARTAAGRYSSFEVDRGLDVARRRLHFTRDGSEYVVSDKLRGWVQTKQLNLCGPDWGVSGPFDLVLLRNVLIYFAPDTRRDVLERIRTLLASDGMLLLGASEGALGLPPSFEAFRQGGLTLHRSKQGVAGTTARSLDEALGRPGGRAEPPKGSEPRPLATAAATATSAQRATPAAAAPATAPATPTALDALRASRAAAAAAAGSPATAPTPGAGRAPVSAGTPVAAPAPAAATPPAKAGPKRPDLSGLDDLNPLERLRAVRKLWEEAQ